MVLFLKKYWLHSFLIFVFTSLCVIGAIWLFSQPIPSEGRYYIIGRAYLVRLIIIIGAPVCIPLYFSVVQSFLYITIDMIVKKTKEQTIQVIFRDEKDILFDKSKYIELHTYSHESLLITTMVRMISLRYKYLVRKDDVNSKLQKSICLTDKNHPTNYQVVFLKYSHIVLDIESAKHVTNCNTK